MATQCKRRAFLVAAMVGIAMSAALPAASATLDVQVWWLRLTVEADPNLQDPGNLLGRLSDSLDGYDFHDLEELPPFGTPYLTIVFPHPDWGAYASDWYTTDYREARPGAGGTWDFEVRSDVARVITLLWGGSSGLAEILSRSTLVNEETSERVEPQLGGSYTTTMTGTVHRFRWVLDLVFLDGFESGDFSGWSQVMGDSHGTACRLPTAVDRSPRISRSSPP